MEKDLTHGNSAYVNELKKKSQTNQQPPSMKGLFFFVCFCAAIFLLFTKACKDDRTPEQIAQADSLQTAKDMEVAAGIIAQNAVKVQLKSPASADFPLGASVVIKPGHNLYVVRSYVDSQNSFGAMIRTNYVVTLSYRSGDRLEDRNWDIEKVTFEER